MRPEKRSAERPEPEVRRSMKDALRSSSLIPNGTTLHGRYLIAEQLGRGGMAVIYRATDLATRRDVALKQLTIKPSSRHYATVVAMFEREFHTLAELKHPHLIEAYDYGRDELGPYYTMELLDGGDLRTLAPLPWADACSKIYDVCSSLALIHSRRLVHRDVSPGNVHCTREGSAKLIDFGAMVPMGHGGAAVGTPHFVAPEVVNRSSLDARTDLFSLGATFYFALTRRVPYRAADFASLPEAWQSAPDPPSTVQPNIPPALDELVLSMIAVEPVTRPRTAFEVMQRLAAITGVERVESNSVSRSYLATPVMLGREAFLHDAHDLLSATLGGAGGCLLIRGVAGIGRSRLLDACALAAKTLGATVLRDGGSAGASSFGVAASLVQQLEQNRQREVQEAAAKLGVSDVLFAAAPDEPEDEEEVGPVRSQLRVLNNRQKERFAIQTALSGVFWELTRKHTLVIAIDDFERIDEPSAAFLAAVASRAGRRKLCIIATAEDGAEPSDRLTFDVLTKHSRSVTLDALTAEQTERLVESVFGDVPHIAIVSERIYALARGNPRATLDLMQHLVDHGRVRYERGAWTLPARIEAQDLPSSADEAMRARLASLSGLARWLAEAQAVAPSQSFTRDEFAALCDDVNTTELDRALGQLLAAQVLVSDGARYMLAHPGWIAVLEHDLTADAKRELHRALAGMYEGRSVLGVVQHALLGGLETRALDALAPLIAATEAEEFYEATDVSPSEVAATFSQALSAAERIGRSEREVNELRRWLAVLSVISDDAHYLRVAPAWFARLKYDSGYTLWEESDIADPQARLGNVMQRAFERYGALPEAERVYRPDEAIKGLAHYAGISMAIGSSRLEPQIIQFLPELLEPFVPLSPFVHTIWQNTLASRDLSYNLRPELAIARWKEVYQSLNDLDSTDPKLVGVFRRAVAHAIGSNEASLGLASAESWASVLDSDPVQRVSALNLRRIVRMQRGDWEGAETLRRRIETLRLQTRARQMFNMLVVVELNACSQASDLTGLQQIREQIAVLAKRAPGWMPLGRFAEGLMHSLCASPKAALQSFERAMELSAPSGSWTRPFPTYACELTAARIDSLVELERISEARDLGEAELAWCRSFEIDLPSHAIERALALAEAKAGAFDESTARLHAVIARQVTFGVTGLHLGAMYEARARVAIYADHKDEIERFAALTAEAYRHGRNSPLGARYERLMREARRVMNTRLPALADFQTGFASHVTKAQVSTAQGTSDSLDDLDVTGDLD